MASINNEQLLLLAGADTQQMKKIVSDFREDASSTISNCEVAARSEDLDGCKKLIHRLKGSSGSLGFSDLYETCLDLEKNGSCDSYLRNIDRLESLVGESVDLALGLLD